MKYNLDNLVTEYDEIENEFNNPEIFKNQKNNKKKKSNQRSSYFV